MNKIIYDINSLSNLYDEYQFLLELYKKEGVDLIDRFETEYKFNPYLRTYILACIAHRNNLVYTIESDRDLITEQLLTNKVLISTSTSSVVRSNKLLYDKIKCLDSKIPEGIVDHIYDLILEAMNSYSKHFTIRLSESELFNSYMKYSTSYLLDTVLNNNIVISKIRELVRFNVFDSMTLRNSYIIFNTRYTKEGERYWKKSIINCMR